MAGEVRTTRQAVSHHRGERLVLNLCPPRINGSRAVYTYGRVFHAIGSLDKNQMKSTGAFHKTDHPLLMSLQSGTRCCSNIRKQRTRVKCECCLHPSFSRWCQFRASDKLDVRNRQFHKSINVKINRTRAYYKSEEYDITEAKVDAQPAMEGPGEAVLVEGNLQKASPWWEQFPKRWVIVLLCFASFLLCNMDRVSICFLISFIFILTAGLSQSQ